MFTRQLCAQMPAPGSLLITLCPTRKVTMRPSVKPPSFYVTTPVLSSLLKPEAASPSHSQHSPRPLAFVLSKILAQPETQFRQRRPTRYNYIFTTHAHIWPPTWLCHASGRIPVGGEYPVHRAPCQHTSDCTWHQFQININLVENVRTPTIIAGYRHLLSLLQPCKLLCKFVDCKHSQVFRVDSRGCWVDEPRLRYCK